MQMWQLLGGLLESRHYADLEPYRNHDCRAVMAACLGVRTAVSGVTKVVLRLTKWKMRNGARIERRKSVGIGIPR